MTTHVTRVDVKTRLDNLLPQAWIADGQNVNWMWNEPTQLPSNVTFGWFGDIRGDLEVAALRAGNPPVNDRWRMDLIFGCWLPGDADTKTGEDGVIEAISTSIDVILTNPNLDDGSGDPSCIYSATPGELDGPTPWRGTDGAGAACRLELTFNARL